MTNQTFNAAAFGQKAIEQSKTFEVLMPSGFTFTLRRPNVQTFAASGLLPSKLFQKMLASERRGGEIEYSEADAAKMIEFCGALVRAACVVVRLVDNPSSPEEIRFGQITDEDFNHVVFWCNSGGVEGDNLEKFRAIPEAGLRNGVNRPSKRKKRV